LVSTTASRSRCAISRPMVSSLTGRRSSTISSNIGRLTIPMSISCARACAATTPRVRATPAGDVDRRARGQRKIGFSFRRAGFGGEIYPRRHSLAAPHPPAAWTTGAFLAVRRLGRSGRALGYRGGLAIAVEPHLCPRGAESRPAQRLLHCGLALPRRPRRRACCLPDARLGIA
jgi:hypothetical protein